MLYLMNKRSSLLHENIMALLHGSFQCIVNPSRLLLLLSLLPSASLTPYLGFYLKGARMAGFSYIPNWLSVFMCGQLFQLIGTATDRCPLLKDGKASQRGAAWKQIISWQQWRERQKSRDELQSVCGWCIKWHDDCRLFLTPSSPLSDAVHSDEITFSSRIAVLKWSSFAHRVSWESH